MSELPQPSELERGIKTPLEVKLDELITEVEDSYAPTEARALREQATHNVLAANEPDRAVVLKDQITEYQASTEQKVDAMAKTIGDPGQKHDFFNRTQIGEMVSVAAIRRDTGQRPAYMKDLVHALEVTYRTVDLGEWYVGVYNLLSDLLNEHLCQFSRARNF